MGQSMKNHLGPNYKVVSIRSPWLFLLKYVSYLRIICWNDLFSANLCSAMASLPSLHKLMLNKELLDSMEEMCYLSSPEEPPAVTRHRIQGYRDLSKQTISLELESRVPISLLPCASGWCWASPWPSVSLSPTGWRHERQGSQGQTASGSPPPLDPSSQSWVWPDAGGQRVRLRDRMGQQPLQVGQERTLQLREKVQRQVAEQEAE